MGKRKDMIHPRFLSEYINDRSLIRTRNYWSKYSSWIYAFLSSHADEGNSSLHSVHKRKHKKHKKHKKKHHSFAEAPEPEAVVVPRPPPQLRLKIKLGGQTLGTKRWVTFLPDFSHTWNILSLINFLSAFPPSPYTLELLALPLPCWLFITILTRMMMMTMTRMMMSPPCPWSSIGPGWVSQKQEEYLVQMFLLQKKHHCWPRWPRF